MLKTMLFSLALISLLSAQAFAQTSTQITISSDRQSYHENDTITISGKISPAPQASTANQSPSIPQTSTIPPQQAAQVPFWAKDTARKWHDGLASNTEFGKVIQYMISSGLVKTSHAITPQDAFDNVPSWVKDTAGWWSQGLIPDTDFAGTIQFLLNEGIIEP